MRRLLLVIFILLLAGCDTAQTSPQASPIPAYLPSLPNTKRPVVSTLDNVIPTRTTIGVTPSLQPTEKPDPLLRSGQPINIITIHMFDFNTGWGIESTGHIVRTRDGGNTWKDATPAQGVYQDGGFFALDANNAWATPNSCVEDTCDSPPLAAAIWHTTDGGETWEPSRVLCLGGDCGYEMDVSARFYYPKAMQFLNENVGWVIVSVDFLMNQDRYRIFRTVDGGMNWEFIIGSYTGPTTTNATGIAYQDMQTGWLGTNNMGGPMEPSHDWTINKTNDGGHTWGADNKADSIELPPPMNLPDDFARKTVGCGVEKVSTIPQDGVDLTFYCSVYKNYAPAGPDYYFHFHSADGGQTWRSWQEIGVAEFINPNLGWRLYPSSGQSNLLQHTVDGGLIWTTIKIVTWQNAQFNFINEQVGWAIVTSGIRNTLVHTIDAGKKWMELKPLVIP